jgi:hypothetical protein
MLGFYSGGWGKANFGDQGQMVICGFIALVHVVTATHFFSSAASDKGS